MNSNTILPSPIQFNNSYNNYKNNNNTLPPLFQQRNIPFYNEKNYINNFDPLSSLSTIYYQQQNQTQYRNRDNNILLSIKDLIQSPRELDSFNLPPIIIKQKNSEKSKINWINQIYEVPNQKELFQSQPSDSISKLELSPPLLPKSFSTSTNESSSPSINESSSPSINYSSSPTSLTQKGNDNESSGPYECLWKDCQSVGLLFDSLQELSKHCKKYHIKKENDQICRWSGCDRSESFTTNQSVLQHLRHRHTGEKHHSCDFKGCFYKSPCKGSVDRHKKAVHNIEYLEIDNDPYSIEKDPKGPFVCKWKDCQVAGSLWNSLSELTEHLKIHIRSQLLKNSYCLWEGCERDDTCPPFKTGSNLLLHLRSIHTGERPYICNYVGCNYRSSSKSNLNTHKKKYHCNLNDNQKIHKKRGPKPRLSDNPSNKRLKSN